MIKNLVFFKTRREEIFTIRFFSFRRSSRGSADRCFEFWSASSTEAGASFVGDNGEAPVFIGRSLNFFMTDSEASVNAEPAWLDRVAKRVKRWRTAGLGPNWVVAVSGGSDSVGLLTVLSKSAPKLGLQLSVAHFDHGGEAGDAEFVADLARRSGCEIDLGVWNSRSGSEAATERFVEAEARATRYQWLVEVAQRRNANVVAVGHTQDDQAETILFRILRGTGPQGVSGMPIRRKLAESIALVRPLLSVSRQEIEVYLSTLGQTWREDPTNRDVSRSRARLRHEVLPKLAADFNPKVVEAIVRLGNLIAAEHRDFQSGLEKLALLATLDDGGDRLVLDRGTLQLCGSSFARAELIRRLWRKKGWPEGAMNARRWRRLARAVVPKRTPRVFSLGAGVEVETTDRELILRFFPKRVTLAGEAVPLPLPGSAVWEEFRIFAELDLKEKRDETVDLDAIVPPLRISAPEVGDRFDPLGMEGKHVLLSDFLRGSRVPGRDRGRVPIVRDAKGIVWVVGHRIAERVKVRESTMRTLGLRTSGLRHAASCD